MHSVNRFVFSVPDLEEAYRFYNAFGLDVRRLGDRLDLYTYGLPHHWASVFTSGKPKRLEYVSFGIHDQDVSQMRERIEQLGIGCQAHPLSDGSGLWLRNPDGTPLQVVVAPKISPSQKCTAMPPSPSRRDAAPHRRVVESSLFARVGSRTYCSSVPT